MADTMKRGKRSALVAELAGLGVTARKSARVGDLEALVARERANVCGLFFFCGFCSMSQHVEVR